MRPAQAGPVSARPARDPQTGLGHAQQCTWHRLASESQLRAGDFGQLVGTSPAISGSFVGPPEDPQQSWPPRHAHTKCFLGALQKACLATIGMAAVVLVNAALAAK